MHFLGHCAVGVPFYDEYELFRKLTSDLIDNRFESISVEFQKSVAQQNILVEHTQHDSIGAVASSGRCQPELPEVALRKVHFRKGWCLRYAYSNQILKAATRAHQPISSPTSTVKLPP
ncbi:unnamed protein product [Sphagnum balticum]